MTCRPSSPGKRSSRSRRTRTATVGSPRPQPRSTASSTTSSAVLHRLAFRAPRRHPDTSSRDPTRPCPSLACPLLDGDNMTSFPQPGFQMPSSRYVLPSFVERTSYGMKESNPYNKLFEERIIFLGVQVDDASANDVMAQLLCLESDDPDRGMTIYINSPGGSFTSLMAIYDTMQYVRADIQTVCLGQAASAAAVLLAAGTPGKRLALPNARVLIHQPSMEGGGYAQASDIEIHANELIRMREWLEETLAKHSGRSVDQVRNDIERDKILTAAEAKDYGLVDKGLASRQTLNPR